MKNITDGNYMYLTLGVIIIIKNVVYYEIIEEKKKHGGGEVEVPGLQVAILNLSLNRHSYRLIYSLELFRVKNKLMYMFENIGVDLK